MKTLICIFAFNEGERIKNTLARTMKAGYPQKDIDVMIADDGSVDGSLKKLPKGILLLRNKVNMGIGNMMKKIFQYSIDKQYDTLVILAGNNKDCPDEISRLLDKINEGYDYVQGSRFMEGGVYGNTPIYRIFATKFVHPMLCSLVTGKWLTESSNGFRAIRTDILKDINWNQSWLNKYQLEIYVLIKAIQLGYKHIEVPVTKIYPNKKTTKMNIGGWWHMLEAPIYLWLGVKK